MWAGAVSVGALVGVGLSCSSVALGFTFLVPPIAGCELLLFGALHLLRLGLSPEDDPRETEREREIAAATRA